mgnify:CR=1 FL=1
MTIAKLVILTILCIIGLVVMEKTSGCGMKLFYKLPLYTLIYCGGHVIAACTVLWMFSPIITMVKNGAASNIEVVSVLVALFMAFVYFITYIFTCIDEVSPLYKLCDNYKTFRNSGPRISFSIFKKMVALHLDNFKFSVFSFRYKGENFTLSFLGYVWALCLCWCEVNKENDRKNNTAQNRVYDKMRRDLEDDFDRVTREREAALASIDKAAHNTQDILTRLSAERR